jgi:hypothetical protein
VPGWIDFIQSNEPRLIAFHEYVSADGAEVEYVQVHPDTDSFENHMRVVESSGRSYTDTLEAPQTSGSTERPARGFWKC